MGKIENRIAIERISKMDSVESVELVGENFVIHYKQEKKS